MQDLNLIRHDNGRVTIDGAVPDRIAIEAEVLERLSPDAVTVDNDGTLTIDGHRFRPVCYHHPIDVWEFQRVTGEVGA